MKNILLSGAALALGLAVVPAVAQTGGGTSGSSTTSNMSGPASTVDQASDDTPPSPTDVNLHAAGRNSPSPNARPSDTGTTGSASTGSSAGSASSSAQSHDMMKHDRSTTTPGQQGDTSRTRGTGSTGPGVRSGGTGPTAPDTPSNPDQ